MTFKNIVLGRIHSFVRDIKVKRTQAVVDTLMQVTDARATIVMPMVFEGYRRMASVVVAKTAADSRPLASLLVALDEVATHYGPELGAELDSLLASLERAEADPRLVQATERFAAAFSALRGGDQ